MTISLTSTWTPSTEQVSQPQDVLPMLQTLRRARLRSSFNPGLLSERRRPPRVLAVNTSLTRQLSQLKRISSCRAAISSSLTQQQLRIPSQVRQSSPAQLVVNRPFDLVGRLVWPSGGPWKVRVGWRRPFRGMVPTACCRHCSVVTLRFKRGFERNLTRGCFPSGLVMAPDERPLKFSS